MIDATIRPRIGPVSKEVARRFVQDHHRHNETPTKAQVSFAIGLYVGDDLVGVATAGWPVNRSMGDGATLEVNRTCVDGYIKNGNSMLYGAVCRAAKAMGYDRVITYTLHEETGASLKASGFVCVADVGTRSWSTDTKVRVRHDVNLFGERRQAQNSAKWRWEKQL
jgi:hypothetical protein